MRWGPPFPFLCHPEECATKVMESQHNINTKKKRNTHQVQLLIHELHVKIAEVGNRDLICREKQVAFLEKLCSGGSGSQAADSKGSSPARVRLLQLLDPLFRESEANIISTKLKIISPLCIIFGEWGEKRRDYSLACTIWTGVSSTSKERSRGNSPLRSVSRIGMMSSMGRPM